ncbi:MULTISPECIES: dimethyl sulfoxide reductase anchor subunit family protein [Variovorax]|jgi:sulfite dehydrogenase (quinone) subunit SoeC|uniref:dimethyl sulfoxide reductase anchor subunit family protein n=1 Tax=Variovorax TaxID=34072 RepID=UPI00086DA2AE|nr:MULTISPECIES: DmsC/YnfH family molybdoenzyme membrane anchor subunit [Variovorax]MBN8757311.1 dimethyl sulfoxide reductase anchor subunit [Variovorax sp.]ODU17972.1 MAG: DMSO reductase [Variovorax sp. SCN 67-85]ODV24507.1 MAG: DMSO reductase [Variovorax sp. SCN 67-20]OJZ13554.1 MAG: DMSO reductase [Variovorax sp. 67-131]UKI06202.1 dimethyl sulfoxide reductase anchor subunit [Variovorax paradoxus]
MHPAFSILFFTTLAGAAQGLVFALALAVLFGLDLAPGFLGIALGVAEVLLVAGLAASFMHLGRKTRAWRAVLMWRTSWMSREVIVLPVFIALVALWWLSLRLGIGAPWSWLLPLLVLYGAMLLWYCTAMIYACLRFIEEWAHPLTIVNFTLIGLSSGLVLACAMAAASGEARFVQVFGPWALVATLAAWAARGGALRRNARLRHKSTLQSATGIRTQKLVQKSMGMSAGSFNTREFFHGVSLAALGNMKIGFLLLAFALPALMVLWGIFSASAWPWLLAVLVQAPGLLAERWFFFAQARHPQNLYYQVVS